MANKFKGEVKAGKYTLVMDFNALVEFEDASGKQAMSFLNDLQEGNASMKDLRHFVHALMLTNHPHATIIEAGDLLSDHGMDIVVKAVESANPDSEEDKTAKKPTPRKTVK